MLAPSHLPPSASPLVWTISKPKAAYTNSPGQVRFAETSRKGKRRKKVTFFCWQAWLRKWGEGEKTKSTNCLSTGLIEENLRIVWQAWLRRTYQFFCRQAWLRRTYQFLSTGLIEENLPIFCPQAWGRARHQSDVSTPAVTPPLPASVEPVCCPACCLCNAWRLSQSLKHGHQPTLLNVIYSIWITNSITPSIKQ